METKRELIYELNQKGKPGSTVLIKGWVRSLRKSKKFSFIAINDGSDQNGIQVVADAVLENYEEIKSIVTGYSLAIEGELVESQGRGQKFEIVAKSVKVIGTVPENYPLQKKATSLEFLRENAHLRNRTNTFGAVFRVRHGLAMATHEFFNKRRFYYLNTPIVTASDCEGAGELFRVSTLSEKEPPLTDKGEVDYSQDYFGKPTYLTVSGQLEAETFALGLGNVYTFGPTFRSENSNTPRHLAEFWMIEPEMAFADLDDAAELAKDYIQYMIDYALTHYHEEISFLSERYDKGLVERLEHVRKTPFAKITYTEAIDILQKNKDKEKFEFPVDWGVDLQTEHERFLAEKHFDAPVIVTDYPKEIKAFYMKLNEDGKTVRAMDVLVPGVGELIGGSQREDDLATLTSRMEECHLDQKDYWWYLDLRKMGGCPHAGFGLGFERAVMYLTGMSNIRDVIPYPRTPKNCEF